MQSWCCSADFAGFLCILIGVVVLVLDYYVPDALANFFGVDVLKDYEESYPGEEDALLSHRCAISRFYLDTWEKTSEGVWSHTTETAEEPSGHQSNGANGKDAEQPRQRPATVIHFKKRGPSTKKPVSISCDHLASHANWVHDWYCCRHDDLWPPLDWLPRLLKKT